MKPTPTLEESFSIVLNTEPGKNEMTDVIGPALLSKVADDFNMLAY